MGIKSVTPLLGETHRHRHLSFWGIISRSCPRSGNTCQGIESWGPGLHPSSLLGDDLIRFHLNLRSLRKRQSPASLQQGHPGIVQVTFCAWSHLRGPGRANIQPGSSHWALWPPGLHWPEEGHPFLGHTEAPVGQLQSFVILRHTLPVQVGLCIEQCLICPQKKCLFSASVRESYSFPGLWLVLSYECLPLCFPLPMAPEKA